MKTKKWLFMSVALLCMTGLIFANGKKDTAGMSEKSGLAPVTLSMVIPGTPMIDQAVVNEAVSDYLKDDLNITYELEQVDWSGWSDRNNLIIASGEAVDILFSAPWCGYESNASKGAYLDLSSYMDTYAKDILNAKYSWLLSAGVMKGKQYAIPTYQMFAQQRGFTMRTDLLEKYGIEFDDKAVHEPREFEEILKIIKENEPDLIPVAMTTGKLLSFMDPWERQGDDECTSVNVLGKAEYVNVYASDLYKESYKLARHWFEQGYINSDVATSQESQTDFIKSGRAFSFSGISNPTETFSMEKRTGYKLTRFHTTPNFTGTNLIQGAMFSVPRASENPERAVMFINRMHSDKNLVNLLVYGIEGTHYVKVSDNIIDAAPGIDPDKPSYYNLIWMFGNQALLYTYGDEDPNAPAILDEFNSTAVKSPVLGFSYNPSDMRNELAALANVVAEFAPVIGSGVVDADENGLYEEFLTKLKTAGIDRLLEDQNKQLEAWKAQK
jgi:putative aldouronate transport system substrate-binding protein